MKKLLVILMSVFMFTQGICYQRAKAMMDDSGVDSSGVGSGVPQEKINKGTEILEGCMSNRIFEITRENVNDMCLIVITGNNEYKRGNGRVQFTNRFNVTSSRREMRLLLLSYVTFLGSYDCAEALIKLGANVNGQDDKKNTALHYAMRGDKSDIRTVKLLLENGADTSIENEEGKTARDYANGLLREYIDNFKVYRDSQSEEAKARCEEIEREEVERKARKRPGVVRPKPCSEEPREEVALEEKSDMEEEEFTDEEERKYEITEKNVNDVILICQKENSHQFEFDSSKVCFRVTSDKIYHDYCAHRLPLGYAARSGQCECVSILLDMGANVDGQDGFGYTALHYAAFLGRRDIIKILLDHGARIDIKSKNGKTAIGVAKKTDVVDFIRSYHKEVVIIQHTCITPENVNSNITVYKLPSVMDYFQYNGKASDVRPLYNANDILFNAKEQTIPLIYAVWCMDLEFVGRLVYMRADVNKQDINGNTALHYAVIQGNDEIVNFLIEQGADTSICNNDGKTAWDCIVGY